MDRKIYGTISDLFRDRGLLKNRLKISTERSRAYLAKNGLGLIPPPDLDLVSLEKDLPQIYERAKNFRQFMEDITLLFDTYFFPATSMTLVTFKDDLSVNNIYSHSNLTISINPNKKYKHIPYTIADFDLDNPKSLVGYTLRGVPKNTFGVQVPGSTFHGIYTIPNNYIDFFEDYDEDVNKYHSRFKRLHTSLKDKSSIDNIQIVEKYIKKDLSEYGKSMSESFFLTPLKSGEKTIALLIASTRLIDSFTDGNRFLPGYSTIYYQKYISWVTLGLHKVLDNERRYLDA